MPSHDALTLNLGLSAEEIAGLASRIEELAPKLNWEQFFGCWAMRPAELDALAASIGSPDLLASHIARSQAEFDAREEVRAGAYSKQDGVAIVDIVGTLTKYGSSFSAMPGGMIGAKRAVRRASQDSDIRGIMLRIDSPGGTVAGGGDLVQEIRRAAERMPVFAFIEDLGASMAYRIATAASKIYVNAREAIVGSIGTYSVLRDLSELYEKRGVKTIVVKSAGGKAVGVPGTEISEDDVARVQKTVSELNDAFLADLAQGRNLTRQEIDRVATGEVFTAPESIENGLVDGIKSYGEVVEELASQGGSRTVTVINRPIPEPRKESAMAEPTTTSAEPTAATYREIKSVCRGASAAFICEQQDKNATIEDARAAWMDHLQERAEAAEAEAAAKVEAAEAEAAEAIEAAKKAAQKAPGSGAPKSESGEEVADDSGDARTRFDALVRAEMERGKVDRQKALSIVTRRNPELHQEYLLATNSQKMHRRLLAEKFDLAAAAEQTEA